MYRGGTGDENAAFSLLIEGLIAKKRAISPALVLPLYVDEVAPQGFNQLGTPPAGAIFGASNHEKDHYPTGDAGNTLRHTVYCNGLLQCNH